MSWSAGALLRCWKAARIGTRSGRRIARGEILSRPVEIVALRKDGSLSHLEASASRWLSNSRIFVTAILRDVNERHAAEEALRNLNQMLERRVDERTAELMEAEEQLRQAQKMEAVGQLTGGVAHDFNNLLTIIRSACRLLRRPDLPEERRRRYVDAIADTVDRASKLTGQLLAFARRQALKPEVFDVRRARVRSWPTCCAPSSGSRIQIVTEIACERCFVEADVSQFETALVNMAVNARDAMDGEGTLTVRVEGVSRMPPIRGHGGGAGRLRRGLARRHGRRHPVRQALPRFSSRSSPPRKSARARGSASPRSTALPSSPAATSRSRARSGGAPPSPSTCPGSTDAATPDDAPTEAGGTEPAEDGRGRRVLVVEDNVEVGRFSTQLLQDLGLRDDLGRERGRSAGALGRGLAGFDVVFSDVVMPGMSGVELGQEIRRRRPDLPVVLTSGYSHVLAEEGRHGFELLQKPYAAEELSRVLRRVIQRR